MDKLRMQTVNKTDKNYNKLEKLNKLKRLLKPKLSNLQSLILWNCVHQSSKHPSRMH